MPPASLTPTQKKEYLELHRKLALHARKKATGTTNGARSSSQAQGKTKEKTLAAQPKSQPVIKDKSLPKSSVRPLPSSKPMSAQVAAVTSKTRSNSEPSLMMMSERRKTEMVGKGGGRLRKPTGPVTVKSVGVKVPEYGEEERRHSNKASNEVSDRKQQQVQRQAIDTTAASKENLQQKQRIIQQHNSTVEECQQKLTTLTHQLTDTVSEIEELELKMENLRKALQVGTSQGGLDKITRGT